VFVDQQPFLDGGITSWNLRDKKLTAEEPMTYIKVNDYKHLEVLEQYLYKFAISPLT